MGRQRKMRQFLGQNHGTKSELVAPCIPREGQLHSPGCHCDPTGHCGSRTVEVAEFSLQRQPDRAECYLLLTVREPVHSYCLERSSFSAIRFMFPSHFACAAEVGSCKGIRMSPIIAMTCNDHGGGRRDLTRPRAWKTEREREFVVVVGVAGVTRNIQKQNVQIIVHGNLDGITRTTLKETGGLTSNLRRDKLHF